MKSAPWIVVMEERPSRLLISSPEIVLTVMIDLFLGGQCEIHARRFTRIAPTE
jgi:hypothetical protein